jgi:hypothetical protein
MADRGQFRRPARAVEERHPPFFLERLHLLADRGMGEKHGVGGRTEGAVFLDRNQRPEHPDGQAALILLKDKLSKTVRICAFDKKALSHTFPKSAVGARGIAPFG